MRYLFINEARDFSPEAISILESRYSICFDPQSEGARKAEVVFIRLAQYIDKGWACRFPDLKIIVTPTTGLNHIDVGYFEENNIKILSLRGHVDFLDNIRATAEHTLALALALIRKLPQASLHAREGGWDRYLFKGNELSGKTVLILGYGRVGRQVHSLYAAFGCTVFAHDIDTEKVPQSLRCNYPQVLSQVDILSIHVAYNASSHHLLSVDILSLLPSHSLIINTSRGEVVDQHTLLTMLRDSLLGGVALDVMHAEPSPLDTQTLELIKDIPENKIIITPHIAGYTEESLTKVETFMAGQLLAYVKTTTLKKTQDTEYAHRLA